MPFRPLKTKCWIAFLILNGYKRDRIKASHYQWTKPGKRTIPVRESYKMVPAFHLMTGCKSLGITLKELYSWADINC